ncbi:MAG: methylisocitrate lyase [Thermoplasmata archaeon]
MHPLKENKNLGPEYLRQKINEGIVEAPGVFNAIGAMIAERNNFDALYLSGSGVAGVQGLPDLSITTIDEVVSEARKITSISKLPLIVDIDTGFGEILNVERTIIEMERAGVSAVHIEDQVMPKKCGHLEGKALVPEQEMIEKIVAAVEARRNKNFMIIARTDARAVEGFDRAVERAKLYLKAGADAIFPEALQTEEEFKEFHKKVPAVLLANMTEYGKSPLLSSKELGEMGYRIVIFPLTAFRAAIKTMDFVYGELRKKGTQREIMDKIASRSEFYDIIKYSEYENEDKEISRKSRKIMD